MKQFIKSYHLFLSQRWLRFVMYLIYPVLLFAAFAFLNAMVSANHTPGKDWEIASRFILYQLCEAVLCIELFADHLIFGGISSKDTNKLEYLKTSVNGMGTLKRALITDALRRLISISLIIGCFTMLITSHYGSVDTMGIILVIFSFVEIGLLIARHFSTLSACWVVFSILLLVIPTCVILIIHTSDRWKILPLITAIAVSVLGRRLILSKARNSYYDNKNEKSN